MRKKGRGFTKKVYVLADIAALRSLARISTAVHETSCDVSFRVSNRSWQKILLVTCELSVTRHTKTPDKRYLLRRHRVILRNSTKFRVVRFSMHAYNNRERFQGLPGFLE